MRLPNRDDWSEERQYLSVLEVAKELELVTSRLTNEEGRRNIEPYYVDDFLTGSTTPQAAIQQAIDKANAGGGGLVMLTRKVYNVTGTINMKSNVWLMGQGYSSVIKVASSFADNVLKFENISNAGASMLRIDGNRSGVSGNQYGFFMGGADDCKLIAVYAHALRGDGIHFYDCDGCQAYACHAWDNLFHGLEIEQCRNFHNIGGTYRNNLIHGIFIFEGEVGASGSHGVAVVGTNCYGNSSYGIGIQGPLSTGITLSDCIMRGNTERGLTLFDRTKNISVVGGHIGENGHFGIYMFRIEGATISGVTFKNNGQAANNSYDDILCEGDSTGRGKNNVFAGNTFIATASNKVRYFIKIGSTDDSPCIIRGNVSMGGAVTDTFVPVSEANLRLCKGNIGRVSENSGIFLANGDGSTNFWDIAHGLTTDEPRWFSVEALHTDVSGAKHFESNSTNIRVVYDGTVPPSGTNNVAFRWFASH